MGILQFKKMHFSRVDSLEDVFEGKLPELFCHNWSDEAKEFYIKRHEEGKRNTFVSCWSMGDNESYAMWQIYAGKNDGVAICTTVDKLRRSLGTVGYDIDIRKINYIDYCKLRNEVFDFTEEQKRLLKESFYSCKSIQYEYEKEIRIIINCDGEGSKFIDIPVNLDIMIQSIYVNPFAHEWFINLIREVVDHYGLYDKPVLHSNIEVKKSSK